MVDNEDLQSKEIIKEIFPYTGKAFIIGITGPPGSGKSSLINRLVYVMRKEDLKIGIIAVDPTSPFTGGSILGDRIRMQEHNSDKNVFIRSMSTRGSLGGISNATRGVVHLLDAFGKDIVIIETVGVGQSEVDIAKNADTTILVLTPLSGDSVQVLKAGIMEIPDIVVINKADLPGAGISQTDINIMLDFKNKRTWRPPVVQTITLNDVGTQKLWEEIKKHRRFLEKDDYLAKLRAERHQKDVLLFMENIIKTKIWNTIMGTAMFEEMITKINNKEIDPLSAAQEILNSIDLTNHE
ncbi:MAG: methylmalonyl Co-A mutase-associated GTPase MeaB [Dethiobacter sp.]|nr:MAG: methylmalonyl Co-A mutase-associated GTPase MeaB [Dethiobacter sp.]